MKASARDTPMMRQYLAIKADHPDAILCYRMGDFYELFLDDAEFAAPILDITLTSRDKDKPDPVPMCGFPVHAADQHIKRLADLGHKVAICEQVEDPKAAAGKRLVKREVVEVVTPGLVGDPAGLDAASEVSVAALCLLEDEAGIAILDASTGDFRATTMPRGGSAPPGLMLDELERVAPREIVCSAETAALLKVPLEQRLPDAVVTRVAPKSLEPATAPAQPKGFDADARDAATRAAAALLAYLGSNQPFALSHAPRLHHYRLGDTMVLDESTRTHLELFANNEDRGRAGTLLECVDWSVTPLGARRLAHWMRYPRLEPESIESRLDGVTFFAERDRLRGRLREALRGVRDLERLLTRALRPTATPREFGSLRASLLALPGVRECLADDRSRESRSGSDLLPEAATLPVAIPLPELAGELTRLLCDALVDDPPSIPRGSRGANETGYIRACFRSELDALRESAAKGREWIAGLEAEERERTGIANLKVKYHPVHGYSLEVSKSQLSRIPDDYERKQTLANVERFTTPALSEMQGKVMGAHERAAAMEREILESIRLSVVEEAAQIREIADAVANVDALAGLAEVARRESWVRPRVDAGDRIVIRAGRHPVVESMLSRVGSEGFVPNDSELDPGDTQILLLTGPNMSGKSTYLRQVALIVLLAQMGSFVPAESAQIGVVDRIFTRVGASDRLARGESTFMVEMRETAEILHNASRRSLLILDEIGRGTSTFDGLSIAWAVVEHLHDTPGLSARTLFATHYHELTDLARTRPRVRNAHFEAREYGEEVVFLRRLVTGGASRSYGIQVARLAGLPDSLIQRARQVLKNLEGSELDPQGIPRLAQEAEEEPQESGQLALHLGAQSTPGVERLAGEIEALDALRDLDVDETTPMDAMLLIHRLSKRLKEGGS